MNRTTGHSALALFGILLGLCVATALAQDKEGDDERDPFAPSGKIQNAKGADRSGFVRTDPDAQLPPLGLRGYVEDDTGNAVALLEIGGKTTYLVRKDDTVSLPQRGGNLVLRIKEVSNLALTVEVGEMRQVVVVR
ncbi:MAG: hypothetical protein ACYTGV_13160 [Planctomycetota bacterium]|jgi:hypothetical protein